MKQRPASTGGKVAPYIPVSDETHGNFRRFVAYLNNAHPGRSLECRERKRNTLSGIKYTPLSKRELLQRRCSLPTPSSAAAHRELREKKDCQRWTDQSGSSPEYGVSIRYNEIIPARYLSAISSIPVRINDQVPQGYIGTLCLRNSPNGLFARERCDPAHSQASSLEVSKLVRNTSG